MSIVTAIGLDEEKHFMVGLLEKMNITHRVTLSFDRVEGKSGTYRIKVEVADAAMIGGWMEVHSLKSTLQWISNRVGLL